jgi:hypothetical protein
MYEVKCTCLGIDAYQGLWNTNEFINLYLMLMQPSLNLTSFEFYDVDTDSSIDFLSCFKRKMHYVLGMLSLPKVVQHVQPPGIKRDFSSFGFVIQEHCILSP